jgi:hypothetical protein
VDTTPEHAFFTAEKGWVPAKDLQVGMHVLRLDGTAGVVQSVLVVEQPERMYNLSVAEAHTFFVGEGEWLVHNASCPLFDKAGIRYTDHFRKRLFSRQSRGITEQKALQAYRRGRLFYDPIERSYIRHNTRTRVSVVVSRPLRGRAITVFEGKASPRWNPVRYRPE